MDCITPQAANGFMLIIDCSQAKVLYVSDTISDVLHEEADSWLGSCFYDLLHPKDIQKVREQLACFDVEEALKASLKQNVAQCTSLSLSLTSLSLFPSLSLPPLSLSCPYLPTSFFLSVTLLFL